ncbi:hypothetical protein KY310_04565 [Candidatus Woesearchaeota archaeon]|nr:hypothetical protein [Candidatus Woesearchaeota archaeon]
MTDEPLEKILGTFQEHLDTVKEFPEIEEMCLILTRYQNRALSKNEHERFKELYDSLIETAGDRQFDILEKLFAERVELDLMHMLDFPNTRTAKITQERLENTLFALDSYFFEFDSRLNLPERLSNAVLDARHIYKNAEQIDSKHVQLNLNLKREEYKQDAPKEFTSAKSNKWYSGFKESLKYFGAAAVLGGLSVLMQAAMPEHWEYVAAGMLGSASGALSHVAGGLYLRHELNKKYQEVQVPILRNTAVGFGIGLIGAIIATYTLKRIGFSFKPEYLYAGITTAAACPIGVALNVRKTLKNDR